MIGYKLRKLRKSRHLTQVQLADALNKTFGTNIERSMISKWENGSQEPHMYSISCIAKFFDVSLDFFSYDEKTSTPPSGNRAEFSRRTTINGLQPLEPRAERLIRLYHELSSEGKDRLVEQAELLVASGRYHPKNKDVSAG